MNITAIIQARMGSTRLPGKVMKQLMDRTVLGHVITRCQAIPIISKVVVATTTLDEDQEICEEAMKYGVSVYRGSKDNVLSRYYEAATIEQSDVIVRITSDCPLIDPKISEDVINSFLHNDYDYVSSGLSNTFPRGLDTEVFTYKALQEAYNRATKEYEFEHVTPYIYQHRDKFKVATYKNSTDQSQYRLTLDTEEDWELIFKIYNDVYTGNVFYWNDIFDLLVRKPELIKINAEVRQKLLGE
ncbi:3-deoxy-manno-octulosonate cytidylyltransferase [compost metagenome]